MGEVYRATDENLGREVAIRSCRRTSRRTKSASPASSERPYTAPDGRRFVVVRGLGKGSSDLVLADGAIARARREAEPGDAR